MADTRVHPEASHAPREVLGYVGGRPVYPIAGGAGDGDDDPGDNEDADDPDDPDDGDDGDDGKEWTPPSKEQFAQLQAKLAKANKEAATRRRELKDLKTRNETDAEKVAREANEAAESKLKPTAIKASAKSALLEADARTDRVGALANLLDMSALDIDDDGEVSGLDDEVKRVKAEYPEFFKSEEDEKPKRGKLSGGGGRKPADDKKAPWDLIAEEYGG